MIRSRKKIYTKVNVDCPRNGDNCHFQKYIYAEGQKKSLKINKENCWANIFENEKITSKNNERQFIILFPRYHIS